MQSAVTSGQKNSALAIYRTKGQVTEALSIYCDESCHLEHDHQKVMLLGCIWLPTEMVPLAVSELRQLRAAHKVDGEIKWTKVSPSRLSFYLNLVDWFFASQFMNFRCVVVPDKAELDHDAFNEGSHDVFYYKMYFSLLNKVLDPSRVHDIYLDIKDTRSNLKVKKLVEILCNNRYDFTRQMIRTVQQVRSHEVQLLQIADLILGAVSYKHRKIRTSAAKLAVAERIEKHRGGSLLYSTPLRDTKLNIFVWQPQKVGG